MSTRVPVQGQETAVFGDEPTVCVLWPDEHGQAAASVSHLVRYTRSTVPILLVGASERDVRSIERACDVGSIQRAGDVGSIQRAGDVGSIGRAYDVGSIEREVDAAATSRRVMTLPVSADASSLAGIEAATGFARGDIALIAPGVLVGPEWLERLRAAAYSDSTVATATALGDRAGTLDIRLTETAQPAQPDAALAVAAGSCRLYPRISSAGAHCVYVRRSMLELLEPFDGARARPVDALAELSLRALSLGMVHVAADDVLVVCPFSRQSAPTGEPLAGDAEDDRTALRRSLVCARTAVDRISVTIDARALASGVGGTQTYTSELIAALAQSRALRLRVVVAPDAPGSVTRQLERDLDVQIVDYDRAVEGVERSAIVHRPQQVFSADDLALLQLLGERVLVSQQDLIAYRNPAYHETTESWQRYRRVTRLALTVADRVLFFSEHAMRDALCDDLAPTERCDVVGIGADAVGDTTARSSEPVPGVPSERDVLVCLGADYLHKNRPFAIALLGALRRRHGWDGCLVLAGPHIPHGSSCEQERRLLAEDPDLAASVVDVGPVDEAQKAWLYERACAVAYPTTYEGFGLVPFEAVRAGRPCLFAPQASLVELAGHRAATLIPWDANSSADAAMPLLVEGSARTQHIRLLRDAAARCSWSAVVERLLGAYERAIREPYRAAAPRAWQELERERVIVELNGLADEYQRAYHDLRANVGVGLPLVCDGGLLSRDEQRGLMRIASRRALRRLLLAPMGVLGRLPSSAQPPATEQAGER